ncbi:hypothetical protein LCGC14_2323280 [marine sediment metagenome]|uniref:Uncharacterized protein n=1 Tax=marine sediment metagenome TaxID=412755 RepID=A0A0F9D4Q7_9ZZZZ
MAKAQVAIIINEDILSRIDHLVAEQVFTNRSSAIEQAVKEKINRLDKSLLAKECVKLDPSFFERKGKHFLGMFSIRRSRCHRQRL